MAKNLLLDASTLAEVVAESTYSGKVDALVNAVANGPVIPVRLTGPGSMVADGFIYKADASNTGVFLADVDLTFNTVVSDLTPGPGWTLRLGGADRYVIGRFPDHFGLIGDPISTNLGDGSTKVKLYLALDNSSAIPGPGPFASAPPRTKIDFNLPFSASANTTFRSGFTTMSLASVPESGYAPGDGVKRLERIEYPAGTQVRAVRLTNGQLSGSAAMDDEPRVGNGFWMTELAALNSAGNGQLAAGDEVWIGFGVILERGSPTTIGDCSFFRLGLNPDHTVGSEAVSNLEMVSKESGEMILRCADSEGVYLSGNFTFGVMHFFAIHTLRSGGADGFANVYHAAGPGGMTQLVARYRGATMAPWSTSAKEAPIFGVKRMHLPTWAWRTTLSSLYVFDVGSVPNATPDQLIRFMRGA